jgi:hypothetical protein
MTIINIFKIDDINKFNILNNNDIPIEERYIDVIITYENIHIHKSYKEEDIIKL